MHRRRLLAGALLGVMLVAAVAAQARAQAGPPVSPPVSPRFLLEAVRVEPPGGDAELLVRRNLPLHPGQMVDAATLIQARRDLAATGLFAEVDLYTTRGSRLGAVIAVVAARPSHRFYVETVVGPDPLRGWYWNVLSLRRTGLLGRRGCPTLSVRGLSLLRDS